MDMAQFFFNEITVMDLLLLVDLNWQLVDLPYQVGNKENSRRLNRLIKKESVSVLFVSAIGTLILRFRRQNSGFSLILTFLNYP